MSAVIATPEMMASAATDLATIGSNVSAAHMVAAAPTLAVIPAAADEVSASIAHLFSVHAQDYQALAGQAAAFNDQFVQHFAAGAFSYAGTEATNDALLQPLTAIPGLIGGAVTAFWNELVNMLTSNSIAFLSPFLSPLFFAASLIFFLIFLAYFLGHLLAQFGPLYVFGIPIWI